MTKPKWDPVVAYRNGERIRKITWREEPDIYLCRTGPTSADREFGLGSWLHRHFND